MSGPWIAPHFPREIYGKCGANYGPPYHIHEELKLIGEMPYYNYRDDDAQDLWCWRVTNFYRDFTLDTLVDEIIADTLKQSLHIVYVL